MLRYEGSTARAVSLSLSLSLVGAVPAGAEILLSNPGLPAREEMIYTRTTGGKAETVTVELVLREETGLTRYRYSSRAPEAETRAWLDADTLFAREVETTTRAGDDALHRTATVLAARKPSPDAVLLAGFETMPVSLRGFPFGAHRKVRLEFVGSAPGGFAFDFSVLGKETLTAAGRSWECWKTQIGMAGIFAVFGKTTLWYSVASPNVLVRSEGASGPPGSPQARMELESYAASGSTWDPRPSRR